MSMTEDEMRDLIILALNPRTERDAQLEVGASNLSNPCDRCRAFEIMGVDRSDPIMDDAWGGRVIGTAIHKHLDHNFQKAADTASETGDDLAQLGWRYPGIAPERSVVLGELTPNRVVTSTTDLWLPTHNVVADHKSTDKRKMIYIRDAIAMIRGTGHIFGRDHEYVVVYEKKEVASGKSKGEIVYRKASAGVSERVYADEILHAQYKILRYNNQDHLYGFSLVEAGERVDQVFLNFICRDSAMTVENRDSPRYLDETAPRGVVSIGFTYNHQYATGLWKNAQAMAKALEEGAKEPMDYPSHPMCGVCSGEATREARATVTIEAPLVSSVDPWAALATKEAA